MNRFKNAVLLLSCFLTGCGLTLQQRTAVLKFSNASRNFAGVTANEFIQSRADVLEMNTLRAKLKDTNVDMEKLDAPLTAERVKERVDAAKALQRYAELLQTLANSSKKEELKVASDAFVTNLRRVRGISLSDEKAGAVGSAVQLVGGLIIERMRAKAVGRVVVSADGSIRQLLDLIERDFSPDEEYWSLGYDLVISALKRSAAVAEKSVDQADLSSLAICAEARALAGKNKTRSATVSGEILDMIKKLRTSQAELLYVVQAKGISTERIDEFAASADEFMTLYEILRKP
jgi:hypothetical protein